jgi:ATP phosphoribosyltransferase
MSEKRTTRDEATTVRTSTIRPNEVADTLRDNTLRLVDEIAKVQPQFAQSISNLQLDNIQTIRSIVQTAFDNQKRVALSLNVPQAPQVSEQIVKHSTEATNNIIRSVEIFTRLTVNALDSARENVKIYNRAIDAVTDFNNNIVKTWTSYLDSQQQQFNRA